MSGHFNVNSKLSILHCFNLALSDWQFHVSHLYKAPVSTRLYPLLLLLIRWRRPCFPPVSGTAPPSPCLLTQREREGVITMKSKPADAQTAAGVCTQHSTGARALSARRHQQIRAQIKTVTNRRVWSGCEMNYNRTKMAAAEAQRQPIVCLMDTIIKVIMKYLYFKKHTTLHLQI